VEQYSWTDGTAVYGEVTVADSWNEPECGGEFGYFTHYYYAEVNVWCPPSSTGFDDDESSEFQGGGIASAYADATIVAPGVCTVDLLAWIFCDFESEYIAEIESTTQVEVPPVISATGDTIWYFDGSSPSGYPISVDLTSDGGSATTWTVTAGASLVNLSTTSGAQTTVTSSGTTFSSAVGDIRITATANGLTSAAVSLTSRVPNELLPMGATTTCDSVYGYLTEIQYVIRDNLLDPMPSPVGVSEDWTTGVVADYIGTNWRRGDPTGVTIPGSSFVDRIGGEAVGVGFIPEPACAGPATPVQHWGQEWYVGSETPGQGRSVQTNTLQKYQEHAEHN